jgi:putative heme-binding domain-containing protein
VRRVLLAALNSCEVPDFAKLTEKLISDPSSSVRITAAGLLGKNNTTLALQGLKSALEQGSAQDVREVYIALADFAGPEADGLLVSELERLAAGKVPALAQLELLETAKKRTVGPVNETLTKYELSLSQKPLAERFAACYEGGDASAGRKVYNEHPVAACKRCHMIDKNGGQAGPHLDGIAARKDAHYLLESILEPNAQIAENFRMILCTLKDGSLKTGVLRGETPEILKLEPLGEAPIDVKVAEIAKREEVPSSMPPMLGLLLTKREIRDLMAFLGTLDGLPRGADGKPKK